MRLIFYKTLYITALVVHMTFFNSNLLLAGDTRDRNGSHGQGEVNVTIGIQGRKAEDMGANLKVCFYPAGSTILHSEHQVQSNAQGEFQIGGLTPGKYVMTIKSGTSLEKAAAVSIEPESVTIVRFNQMLALGDANGDNQVNSQDYALLADAFGSARGIKGFNERVDFNGDATVSPEDFALMTQNFDQQGYMVNTASFEELSLVARGDLYMLIVDKIFFRRFYAVR